MFGLPRTWLVVVLVMVAATLACGGGDDAPKAGEVFDLGKAKPELTITYAAGDQRAGSPNSIASGDFNGDGKTDLLLGLPWADGPDEKRPDAGEAYVLYGPLSGEMDLTSKTPDVRILGAISGDNAGSGVAAGDLNGDGFDDIIVGAPNSNGIPQVRTDLGEAYIIFGRPVIPATIDTLNAEQDAGLLPAEGFAQVGRTFAVADVNDDGIDDLVAGAPYAGRIPNSPPGSERTTVGEVYVVYGKHDLHGQVKVADNAEDVRLAGLKAYDQFGQSVAATDVNGDGVADIVVGGSGYDGPAGDREDAGGTFVYYGGNLPATATINDAQVKITGAQAGDFLGSLVAAADLNGDGRAEIVTSAPGAFGPDDKRNAAGEASIVDPTKGGADIDLASAKAPRLFGPTVNQFAPSTLIAGGSRIAFGSDLDGSADRQSAGKVYLTKGLPAQDIDLSATSDAVTPVLGAEELDGLGSALAFADLNNDGADELLMLATGNAAANAIDQNFTAKLYAIKLN
jgi:hypothetical protein